MSLPQIMWRQVIVQKTVPTSGREHSWAGRRPGLELRNRHGAAVRRQEGCIASLCFQLIKSRCKQHLSRRLWGPQNREAWRCPQNREAWRCWVLCFPISSGSPFGDSQGSCEMGKYILFLRPLAAVTNCNKLSGNHICPEMNGVACKFPVSYLVLNMYLMCVVINDFRV